MNSSARPDLRITQMRDCAPRGSPSETPYILEFSGGSRARSTFLNPELEGFMSVIEADSRKYNISPDKGLIMPYQSVADIALMYHADTVVVHLSAHHDHVPHSRVHYSEQGSGTLFRRPSASNKVHPTIE
eukprot:scaffold129225_cov66-Phaeocystis_antarctica.AAC.1